MRTNSKNIDIERDPRLPLYHPITKQNRRGSTANDHPHWEDDDDDTKQKDPNKPKIIQDEEEKRNPNILRGWLNTLPAGNRVREQHQYGMRINKRPKEELAEKTALVKEMEARHAQFDYHLSDFDFLNEGWKYEYLQTMYGEKHDGIWDGCDDNDAMEQAREGERKFCFYYAMRSGIPLENVQTHWDQISKRLQKHLGRLGVLLAREQKDERNSESLIAQRQKEIEKLERGLAKMDTLLSLCYGDYRQVLQNEVVQMIQEKTDHEKKIRELAKDKINKRIEEIASRMEVLKKALKGGEGWYYIEEEERKAIEKKLRGY